MMFHAGHWSREITHRWWEKTGSCLLLKEWIYEPVSFISTLVLFSKILETADFPPAQYKRRHCCSGPQRRCRLRSLPFPELPCPCCQLPQQCPPASQSEERVQLRAAEEEQHRRGGEGFPQNAAIPSCQLHTHLCSWQRLDTCPQLPPFWSGHKAPGKQQSQ